MKNILLIVLLFGIGSTYASAEYKSYRDTSKNIIEATKLQFKVANGMDMFYSYNYRGALNTFREVLALDEKNAGAMFGIARCQYALGKFDLAKEYIDRAMEIDSTIDRDVYLIRGQIEHRLELLDDAINDYEKHKATLNGKEKLIAESGVDTYIAQCKYAKEAMANPVDVKITNIGDAINTSAPEFAPCISQDGRILVFTSRRSDTKGGNVDKNFDFMYYSDIYISDLDTITGKWTKAVPAHGKVNTEFHDGALGFTPKGKMLIYRNIMKVTGSGDIYVSKRSKTGKWAEPKPILEKEDKKISKKINSSYFESSATMTADGKFIYFVSERPGGLGRADIYVVEKKSGAWQEPKNVGATINTKGDEKSVFISLDGNTMYFSSNGYKNSLGSYDIYISHKKEDGTWSEPKNMGYPINTTKEEKTISISPDGKTAYVSAYYDIDSKGNADVFTIDISKLNK